MILLSVLANFDFFFVFRGYIIFFTDITNDLSSLTSSAYNERTNAPDKGLRQDFSCSQTCKRGEFLAGVYFAKRTSCLKRNNFGFLKEIICNLELFPF